MPFLLRSSLHQRHTGPHIAALADVEPEPYWLARTPRPQPASALTRPVRADLLIVGGGYTGLWAALQAKERDPGADVVLVEARECGWAASGRNGGFCVSSLTHGIRNGHRWFAPELGVLERLGMQNLDGIEKTIRSCGIDCDFERTGELEVAVADWQLRGLRQTAQLAGEFGHDVELLDADQVRAEVRSPTYRGALWMRDSAALLDPARLAWGLREACLRRGVRIYERTPVEQLDRTGRAVLARTPYGSVLARQVLLATNGFPPLLRRLRRYVLPVYDHVLATEPLTDDQLAEIGWARRQGISDAGNQFHYYRLTSDNRIIWGGYDAIYHYGGAVRDELHVRPETFAKLAGHFFATFPQLEGLRFTHAWGGVVDTCSRFCPFMGTTRDRRIGYALGYTGLGVAATRFASGVVLDLLAGRPGEHTGLRWATTRPLPWPPEPLRWLGVQLTRWSLGSADRHGGRRNWWLRRLDSWGLGFTS
ncbi:NAD(P)/FAD-dependent oxidoreductase [Saccharopolyspora rectivirgula]|uniref:NAD(P)/FAD-dependent oxidoreductase n=1 Tax=Saccharopolyspora rectivirgula TaxID=28042 RepID=UPI0004280EFD|nr:FAD-dependent oxidoreductase [Saccharopolyspora rectivirgula]